MTIDGCPHPDTLEQLWRGTLVPADRLRIERHVMSCSRCTERLIQRLSHSSTVLEKDARTPGRSPDGGAAARFLLLEDERDGSAPAYDTVLERKVLLRFVGPEASPGAMTARLGEAAALARLSHPNLVKVHDVGVLDGRPFVAMELVQGTTVAQWPAPGPPRRAREIAEVVASAAGGLAAAHAEGIAHGGVSADHIVVVGHRVVVTGFGGLPADGADLAADVRALGAVLYALVHGTAPGTELAVAPRARGLARLHRLALAALGREPPSAEALARALASDPARRTRNVVLAAGTAAIVVAAFAAGAHLRASPQRRCLAGAAVMADIWTGGRRAELTRRYAAFPAAAAQWAALARTLDEYSDRWRSAYAQVCRAPYGHRGVPEQLFDRRMRCLTSGRLSVEALLSSVAAATPEQMAAATALEPNDVSGCGSIDRLEARPVPRDPRSRAALEDVDRLLSRALAQQNVGAYAASIATAVQAVEEARMVGHDPTLAEALLRQATSQIDRGGDGPGGDTASGLDRAVRLLEEAYSVADRAEDDIDRLTAAAYMITVQERRQTYAEADRWAGRAEALLAREGVPPTQGSMVETSIGYLRKFELRRAEAVAAFRKALEFAEKEVPQRPRRIALTQSSICQMLDAGPEQIDCARRSLEMNRAAYGADNPEAALDEAILAEALVRLPSTHAEGCRVLRRARSMMGESVDAAHPNAVAIVTELSECLAYEGEVAEARRLIEEVIAHRPGPNDLANALVTHAYILGRHGDVDAALRKQSQALAIYRKLFEPCDERVVESENALAALLVRRRRDGDAQRLLREGVAACEGAGVDNADTVDLRARLGHVLLDQGRFEPALRTFEEAQRRHGKVGSDDRGLALTLHGLGASLLALGRTDEAVAALERGYRMRPAANEQEPELRADLALALARALRARPRDRERACALGLEAVGEYRRLSAFERELREAERWLIGQGCRPRVARTGRPGPRRP